MKYAKTWAMLFFVISVLFLFAGCVSESTEGDDDDDMNDPTFGLRCTDDSACGVLSCIPISGDSLCSMACSTDSECQSQQTGSCCMATTAGAYCAPSAYCTGDDDDDDSVGDDDDDTASGACDIPDTYRCNGTVVERCNALLEWEEYMPCGDDQCCINGSCQSGYDVCPSADDTCPVGEYRCRGIGEIQECKGDPASWSFYRSCDTQLELCLQGECVPMSADDDDDDDDNCGNAVREGNEECDGNTDSCGATMSSWECIDCKCIEEELGDPCYIEQGCEASNEYCLPDEIGAEIGHCRKFCDLPGEYCPTGYECLQGTCQILEGACISDAQCTMDEYCKKLPDHDIGRCTRICDRMGVVCPSHTVCDANPTSPNYGECIPDNMTCEGECTTNSQCNLGWYCEKPMGYREGCCREMCTGDNGDNPCPAGMHCRTSGEYAGQCGLGEGPLDCPPCAQGTICNTLYGQCVPNCPPCDDMQCCDAVSAPNCYTCVCKPPLVCGILLKPCCAPQSCSAIVYGVLGFCV